MRLAFRDRRCPKNELIYIRDRNTLIFAEREDASIGEAGWEPGRGRIRPDANGNMPTQAAVKQPKKRRIVLGCNQLFSTDIYGRSTTPDGYCERGFKPYPASSCLAKPDIQHECNLTPDLESESYRSIVRKRQAKAAEPKRKYVSTCT